MSGNGVSDQDSGLRVHEPSILAMYPWVETVTNMTVTVSLRNEEGVETLVSLNDIPLGLAQMTSNNYKVCVLSVSISYHVIQKALWDSLRSHLNSFANAIPLCHI
jgi:hypothetical protein